MLRGRLWGGCVRVWRRGFRAVRCLLSLRFRCRRRRRCRLLLGVLYGCGGFGISLWFGLGIGGFGWRGCVGRGLLGRCGWRLVRWGFGIGGVGRLRLGLIAAG